MRPVTLLLLLIVLATVGGAAAYTNYQRILFAAAQQDRASAPEPPPAARSATSEDPDPLKKKIAFFEDQIKLLKKENENLGKSVEKLSQAAVTKPSATPETAPAGFSAEGLVSSVEEIRQLKFKRPLKFVRVPASEIEKRIRGEIEADRRPTFAEVG